MLDVYISQIIKNLNQYLDTRLGTGSNIIEMTNFVYLDEQENLRNKILCGVVNISREKDMGNASEYVAEGNMYREKRAPLLFNVDLLFASNFESTSYLNGLERLSSIVGFFQANPSIAIQEDAILSDSVSIRIPPIDEEKLTNLWRRISKPYLPSVVCNISTIAIRGDNLDKRHIPRIEKVDIKF